MDNLNKKYLNLILKSNKLKYSSRKYGKFPGDIISNEVDRYKWKLPNIELDLLIGVGTLVNYDLIGKMNAKKLIILDQSPDVMIAHEYFYKKILSVSNTNLDFLQSFVGPIKTVKEGFKKLRLLTDHSTFQRNIEDEFVTAVIESPVCKDNPFPFKNIANIDPMKEMLRYLHDYSESYKVAKMFPLFVRLKNFSFINNKLYFSRVKKVFDEGNVEYILSSIENRDIIKPIQSSGIKDKVVGLYLSNVIELIPKFNLEQFINDCFFSEKSSVSELYIFKVNGLKTPFEYEVLKIKKK